MTANTDEIIMALFIARCQMDYSRELCEAEGADPDAELARFGAECAYVDEVIERAGLRAQYEEYWYARPIDLAALRAKR